MPLTYAYRLHPTLKGRIQHVPVDLADLPRMLAEGWKRQPGEGRRRGPPLALSTSVGARRAGGCTASRRRSGGGHDHDL